MPDNIQGIIAPQAIADLDTTIVKISGIITEVNALAQAAQGVSFNKMGSENLVSFAQTMKVATDTINQAKTAMEGMKAVTIETDALSAKLGADVRAVAMAEIQHAESMQKSATIIAQYNGHSKEYVAVLNKVQQAEKIAAQAAVEAAKVKTEAAKQATEASKQATEVKKQETINFLALSKAESEAAAQAAKVKTESAKQSTQEIIALSKIETDSSIQSANAKVAAAKIATEAKKQEATEFVALAKAETEITRQATLVTKSDNESKLAAAKITTETARQLKILTDEQIKATKEAERLAAAQDKATAAAQKAQSPYAQLSKQYRDAKQAAIEMSAQIVLLEQRLAILNKQPAGSYSWMRERITNEIQRIMQNLPGAINKANELDAAMKRIDASVGQYQRNVGNYVNAVNGGVDRANTAIGGFTQRLYGYFGNLKAQFQSFMSMMIGFYAIYGKIREAIRVNAELSDSFADLKIRIHGTNADVATLVDSLKKLDTRTSLTQLVDIAAVIAKKGVAKEEIAGVTKAVDDLMIALGREIGDPHEAVSSLVKLSTIYNDDKHVTADKINAIANAIQKLTTSGVATGPWLISFAEQMGGIRGITGMTIDKVLGLGAALEELGQRSSVSSTALSQVVVKLFTEQQKYADLTGKSLGQFKQMLHDDVLGTLVMVAQSLKGNAGEMEHFFEGMADMHAKGQRAVGVIGDLAANVGYANKRMQDATKAMHENGNVTAAAAEKQKTLAASLDRVHKAFEVAMQSNEFTETLKGLSNAVILLINILPTLIELGKVWLAGWVLINRAMILNRMVTLASSAATQVYAFTVGVATAVQQVYTISMAALTRQTTAATAATTIFNNVIRLSPIGWLLTIIGLTAAALVFFANSAKAATDELTIQGKVMRMQIDLLGKAKQATADTEANIRVLVKVIKDETASLETKKRALSELIAISPEYLSGLTLQNAATAEGTKLLNEYIMALRLKAAYTAAQAVQSEQAKKDIELERLQAGLERDRAQGKTGKSEITGDAVDKMKELGFSTRFNDPSLTYIDWLIKQIVQKRKKLSEEMDITDELVKRKYIDLFKPKSNANGLPVSTDTRDPNRRVLADIQADIEAQEKIRDNTNKSDKQHEDAIKRLIVLQKELDEYLGKQSGSGKRNGLSEMAPDLHGEKEYAEARANLTKQRLLQEVEANREIMDDEKRGLQERLQANIQYQNAKIEIAVNEFQRQKAIEDIAIETSKKKIAELEYRKAELRAGKGGLSNTQRRKAIADVDLRIGDERSLQSAAGTRMVAAYEAEQNTFLSIQSQGQEKSLAILKSAHKKEIDSLELKFAEQKSIELQGLMTQELLLKDSLEKNKITRQEYNKAIKALQEKENAILLQADVYYYEGMLKVAGLSIEEQIEYTKRLAAARKALASNEGEPVKKEKPEVDPLKKLGGIIFMASTPQGSMTDEEFMAKKRKYMDDFSSYSINLAKTTYDAINTIRNNSFAAEEQQLQIRANQVKFQTDQKIAAINASTNFQIAKDNQIAELTAQSAAQQAQIQQQQRELSIKKAKADKEAAEMNIIANTAMGIVKAMAEYGYAGIPLAALIAATGAVQYSAAASAQLPQYKYGTDATVTPQFIAGEGGEPEYIKAPGKPGYWTDTTARVYTEPLGTSVTPLHKVLNYAVSGVNRPFDRSNSTMQSALISIGMNSVVRAIESNTQQLGSKTDELAYALLKSRQSPVNNIYISMDNKKQK